MAQTVIALYDDFETAEDVVEDLVEAGFPRTNISLVANDAHGQFKSRLASDTRDDDDVSGGEGAGFGAVVGTLVGLGVALIPGVGPILAAGPLAAALMAGIGAAAGAATGGIVASLVDFGIPEDEAEAYIEGLRRGGTLLSVTVDEAHLNRVEGIMNAYNPIDVEHRATTWREAGWGGYDDDAPAYSQDEIERERQLYGSASGAAMAQTGDSLLDNELNADLNARTGNRGVRVYSGRN